MAIKPTTDDLVQRVRNLEEKAASLEALMWRRQQIKDDNTIYTVTSNTYADESGSPLILSGVVPGPTGLIIVGLTLAVTLNAGEGVAVSFTATGPTPVAGDDFRAAFVINNSTGADSYALTRFVSSPVLSPGAYDIECVVRATAGPVGMVGRGLITIAE